MVACNNTVLQTFLTSNSKRLRECGPLFSSLLFFNVGIKVVLLAGILQPVILRCIFFVIFNNKIARKVFI